MDIFNFIKNLYVKHLDAIVEFYWQSWHFDMGKEHRSYNNEGAAFKHAYMSAELALFLGQRISKWIGYIHEITNPLNSPGEMLMDLHNNEIGRTIALEIKQSHFLWFVCGDLKGIIASKVMNRLAAGYLIVSPKDEDAYNAG